MAWPPTNLWLLRMVRHSGNAKIELVVSDDPSFAAAKAAALWSRLRIELGAYCHDSACCFTQNMLLSEMEPDVVRNEL
jgi:hypothetical protein